MGDQLEFTWGGGACPLESSVERSAPAPSAPPASPVQSDIETLRLLLWAISGETIMLTITENRSTMLSYRRKPGGYIAIRAHRNFLAAPRAVWESIGQWVKKPRLRRSADAVDKFIRENQPEPASRPRAAASLRTQGEVHDLRRLFDEVNAQHFDGSISAAITWGMAPRVTRRRNIRLGSFAPAENLIRIHPHMDAAFVPLFFIRYVVFHEMLHAHLGIEDGPNGRRKIHPPAFRAAERAYPDFDKAELWLKSPRNLNRLLRGAR